MKEGISIFLIISLAICINFSLVSAATYYVSTSGSDSNSGTQAQPYRTIQKCANVVQAGDTCIVLEGIYSEHVVTKSGGTDESNRLTFKAQGAITMQGFDIQHPYVTIEGFDITGYQGGYGGHLLVISNGNYCQLLNNTIRDGAMYTYGIYFRPSYASGAVPPNNCIVRGNRISNLKNHWFVVSGENHIFENNIAENLNDNDAIYLYGINNTFRRNIFRNGARTSGNQNHADFLQMFSDSNPGAVSHNHLFEENWIENLQAQVGQLNNGLNTAIGFNSNFHDIVFRRNVFANISGNMNIEYPGVHFENNIFYRTSYLLSGVFWGSSLKRGEPINGYLKNNAFVGSGTKSSNGFYGVFGAVIDKYTVGMAMGVPNLLASPEMDGVYTNLINNGYINSNGVLLNRSFQLRGLSDFVIDSQYESYKASVFDILQRTVDMDKNVRQTFTADYNFVAGFAPEFLPKDSNPLNCAKLYPLYVYDFCEVHGINGGNPQFQDINNPIGPDGIPFTSDDGFIPLPGSPLCGSGEGGSDIGPYTCASGNNTSNRAGDINNDGSVNVLDIILIVNDYGKSSGFDVRVDLIKDNFIDLKDIVELTKYWGRSY